MIGILKGRKSWECCAPWKRNKRDVPLNALRKSQRRDYVIDIAETGNV
jgi:hypothetical protein